VFRSCGFAPLQRLTPRQGVSVSTRKSNLPPPRVLGLLHPSTGQGSLCFIVVPTPSSPSPKTASLLSQIDAVPHSAVHTPRRSPLPDSRSASLRPLPPCCYAFICLHPVASLLQCRPSTSRLCSVWESVVRDTVLQVSLTLSFHGLCSPPRFWKAD
jgi:hypothetical protein